MTGDDVYDEEGRNLSSESRGLEKLLRERADRWSLWLDETTERLALKHGIKRHGPFRDLLRELHRLSNDHPPILTVEPGKVVVQRDLTPWKEAKEKLETLSKVLANADDRLWAAVEDPVQRAALVHVDTTEEVAEWIAGIRNLRALIEMAADIDGRSGNRPNPDWHARAAEMCCEFWRDHMGERPSGYFNKESKLKRGEPAGSATTKPGNKFSCWFCDVMHAVAQMTPTQCQTALRKKRPQKTSEF